MRRYVSCFGTSIFLNPLSTFAGAMTSVPEQVNDRIIFYRHTDANFYGAFSYAIGKAVSLLPQVSKRVCAGRFTWPTFG